MSEALGNVEMEMPNDIQAAVERGQRVADGRFAYIKWSMTGVWDGDVLSLLEFVKQSQLSIDDVAVSKEQTKQALANVKAELAAVKDDLEVANKLLDDTNSELEHVRSVAQRLEAENKRLQNTCDDEVRQKNSYAKDMASLEKDNDAIMHTLKLLVWEEVP